MNNLEWSTPQATKVQDAVDTLIAHGLNRVTIEMISKLASVNQKATIFNLELIGFSIPNRQHLVSVALNNQSIIPKMRRAPIELFGGIADKSVLVKWIDLKSQRVQRKGA